MTQDRIYSGYRAYGLERYILLTHSITMTQDSIYQPYKHIYLHIL